MNSAASAETVICGTSALGVGDSPPHALRIEYSFAALDEIRRLAVDGFHKFGHGGLEVGGVLYGVHEAGTVRILGTAEITCEHARGPSFVLSEKDEATLDGQLGAPVEGLIPVGWYTSHTRRGLALTAADLRLYDRFFPLPWHVALTVCPDPWGTARAGFFFREPDGRVRAEAPYQEFALEPRKSSVETASPDNSTAEEVAPAVAVVAPASRRSRLAYVSWWLSGAFSLLAVAAILATRGHPPAPRLGLRTYEIAGQMRIEWDHAAAAAAGSQGRLEIDDGGAMTVVAVDGRQLRSGSITYVRRSGSVLVHLRVEPARSGRTAVEEFARFVGTPAPAPPPAQNSPEKAAEERPLPAPRMPLPDRPAAVPVHRPAAIAIATLSTPARAPTPAPALPLPPAIANAPAALPAVPLPPAIANAPAEFPVLPLPHVAPQPHISTSASSGRLVWTGELTRRAVVEIEAGRASTGSLTGTLPGVPVTLQIHPAEFGSSGLVAYTSEVGAGNHREPPGAGNGWNATRFDWNPGRAHEVSILEAPNASNGYKRLVLRSNTGGYPVILIEWSVR